MVKNIKRAALLFVSVLLLLTGCNSKSDSALEGTTQSSLSQISQTDALLTQCEYTFTDSLGREVTISKKPERVISLMGSFAETWVLSGGQLVGVTDDVSERDIEINDEVAIIGTVKDPNIEKIIELSPDLVILSAELEAHQQIAETLDKAGIKSAFFTVEYFEDYLWMLKICTDMTARADLYEENGSSIQAQIDAVLEKINSFEKQPTVLFLRAMSSKAKAKKDDNMTGKILADLNTDNIATRHVSLLEDLSIEEVVAEDPDFIFVVTMGDEEEALSTLKKRTESDPAWNSLKAVKNGNYIVLPKDLFHFKPNARWGESYEYLAKIIYPEIFDK